MHALHLATWHPVIDGVSGTFILEQCAAIRTTGAEVGLIFSRIEGLRTMSFDNLTQGLPAFVRSEEPVHTLGFKSWNVPLMPVRWREAICRKLLVNRHAAYVGERGNPDILHAHAALETGAAARSISRSTGVRYVVTEHSSEVLNGVHGAARRAAAARIYRDAHRVLAVSDALAARIAEICPEARIKVVPNLVRDFVFKMRREAESKDSRLRVVSIGSLTTGKRMQDAIQALAGLPPSLRSRVEHHIVGDGPERQMLKDAAATGGVETHFHGNLPHAQAMNLLSRADLFVHASAYETFGIVIAEAMALGVPSVATRAGGTNTLISERTGCMVEVGDVRAMTHSIADVLNAIDEWSAKRESIAEAAFVRFHETVVAKTIIEAYT